MMNKKKHQIEKLADAIEAGQREHNITQIGGKYVTGNPAEGCALGCAYAHINPELTWAESQINVRTALYEEFPVLQEMIVPKPDKKTKMKLSWWIHEMNDLKGFTVEEIAQWLRDFAKEIE